MSKLVSNVAHAIHRAPSWHVVGGVDVADMEPDDREDWHEIARAGIAAVLREIREPSPAMIDAVRRTFAEWGMESRSNEFTAAMIAAAINAFAAEHGIDTREAK